MTWNPGTNPFPTEKIKKITDFEYLDELKFVRHAQVHVDKPPKTLWQLSANFRARMVLHPKDGEPRQITIKAPRGMYTDLSSVPKVVWSIVGPIGKHLEASIIHDYLYMAWTDFRDKASRRDKDFADEVFLAGMRASRVHKRKILFNAVQLAGWRTFRKKSYTLSERMDEWLPMLARDHDRND